MLSKCCLSNCNEVGVYKLSKIQGKVYVKSSFINTCPKDWLLCKQHFIEYAEKLDCCIAKCSNTASTFELPDELIESTTFRQDCSHHLICLNHHKQFLKKPTTIKRPIQQPKREELPPEKFNATAEEQVESITEIQNKSNKQTTNDISEQCYVHDCSLKKEKQHFFQFTPTPLCQIHAKQYLQMFRRSILQQQIAIQQEIINTFPTDPNHPLSNYSILQHDLVCSLCFQKQPYLFPCTKCSSVYCSDCYKHINKTMESRNDFVCLNCSNNYSRDKVIKEQLDSMLPIIEKNLSKTTTSEFKTSIINEENKMKNKIQLLQTRRKHMQSLNAWLNPFIVLEQDTKNKQSTQGVKQNILFISKAAYQYMMLPHFSPITTSQFISLTETIRYALINNQDVLDCKFVEKYTPIETLLLAHSSHYIDILQRILKEQTMWVPSVQLERLLKFDNKFTYSTLLLRLSLETTEALCDAVRVISQIETFKSAIVFCGASGGLIKKDGCLIQSEDTENEELSYGVGDFDDDHSNQSNPQPSNSLGFPNGIKPTTTPKIIYQTLLVNYLSVASRFIVFRTKDLEVGTFEILQNEMDNKQLTVYGCDDFRDLSKWNVVYNTLKTTPPDLLFVTLHTNIYLVNDDMSIFSSIAKDLKSLTTPLKHNEKSPTQIIHLINTGFIQEYSSEMFQKVVLTYVDSITH
ncbi:THAP-type domain-containing protein [Entamoeba marina]